MDKKLKSPADIGMVGLGVMGRNLVLNMADHGFKVAGYDRKQESVDSLHNESKEEHELEGATDLKAFVNLIRKPRAIMLLVTAGDAVDNVINGLLPLIEPGDLIIDGGNSHFTDTNRRFVSLREKKIQFMGVGISGGEEGARLGPSIMPGGSKEAYARVRNIFEAVAAKVNNEPCVAYLGPASAGHYVKMVHNGIEYGIMQLIAETYDLMKRGLGFGNEQLYEVYSEWNAGELSSYLLEITSHIFNKKDKQTGKYLIDEIKSVAKQKGTGMWTSQNAMALQVPTPTIDIAVTMRDLSGYLEEREKASQLYHRTMPPYVNNRATFLTQLQGAMLASLIAVYAQGMSLLSVASKAYKYELDLETVARIWRGGCIIRARLLEDIRSAFKKKPDLTNLLLDPNLSKKVMAHQELLRQIVGQANTMGIPAPGLMATLSYFDALRSVFSPANLIQAQRDYFGSHTYERIDEAGIFHTEWEKDMT